MTGSGKPRTTCRGTIVRHCVASLEYKVSCALARQINVNDIGSAGKKASLYIDALARIRSDSRCMIVEHGPVNLGDMLALNLQLKHAPMMKHLNSEICALARQR